MNTDIIFALIINIIFTALIYLIYPLYLRFIDKKYNGNNALKISILNCIVAFILFTTLYSILEENKIAKVEVSVFYCIISYWILVSKKNKQTSFSNISNTMIEKNNATISKTKGAHSKEENSNTVDKILYSILVVLIIILISVLIW